MILSRRVLKVTSTLLFLGGTALLVGSVLDLERRSLTGDRAFIRPSMVGMPGLPATFTMGTSSETGLGEDELPRHPVTLRRHFALSETEVTQVQFERVMGYNPVARNKDCAFVGSSDHLGGQLPAFCISFVEAASYCNRLTEIELEGVAKDRESAEQAMEPCYAIQGQEVRWKSPSSCRGYRLPTEAEWEFAARAGRWTELAGAPSAAPCTVAVVVGCANFEPGKPRIFGALPVASLDHPARAQNGWGLYDLSGNVWEWTWDRFEEGGRRLVMETDPLGPETGSDRVVRGGSWRNDVKLARVSSRLRWSPTYRVDVVGFRLCRTVTK